VAALVVLLACSAVAPAEDLYEKQEEKEAKLSEVRERKGVLTTTISRYRERIERLTDEVAGLRAREAEVRARLVAKQTELDRAVAELDGAKKHLAVVKARLKRALVALRERLVAIYETGTPDVLSVIVDSGGYDELVNRTEYLNRINGLDEAVVSRVRELRDQVKRTVARLRSAKNRIEAARDAIAAEEQALESARAAVQSRQTELVAVRRDREAALATINDHEHHIEGDLAEIQAEIAVQLGKPPRRRCRPGRSATARAG
jgi:peptidoglycan hydrolase CwlO-like protein